MESGYHPWKEIQPEVDEQSDTLYFHTTLLRELARDILQLKARVTTGEARLNAIDKLFNKMDIRLASLEKRITSLEEGIASFRTEERQFFEQIIERAIRRRAED